MSIWVKCMYVYGVWMCVREFWSVHAFYGAANALYWKCLKRQNSTYLTLLKHQNTKTSLYKLSKNHWVITLLENFGSVRRKLQSTVFLDHPVLQLLKPLTLVKGDLTKHMEAMTRIGKTRIATIIGITTCDSFAEKYSSFNIRIFLCSTRMVCCR